MSDEKNGKCESNCVLTLHHKWLGNKVNYSENIKNQQIFVLTEMEHIMRKCITNDNECDLCLHGNHIHPCFQPHTNQSTTKTSKNCNEIKWWLDFEVLKRKPTINLSHLCDEFHIDSYNDIFDYSSHTINKSTVNICIKDKVKELLDEIDYLYNKKSTNNFLLMHTYETLIIGFFNRVNNYTPLSNTIHKICIEYYYSPIDLHKNMTRLSYLSIINNNFVLNTFDMKNNKLFNNINIFAFLSLIVNCYSVSRDTNFIVVNAFETNTDSAPAFVYRNISLLEDTKIILSTDNTFINENINENTNQNIKDIMQSYSWCIRYVTNIIGTQEVMIEVILDMLEEVMIEVAMCMVMLFMILEYGYGRCRGSMIDEYKDSDGG